MSLARDLLKREEVDAVIDYFELCAKFWELDSDRLESWTALARAGSVPDFGPNLR